MSEKSYKNLWNWVKLLYVIKESDSKLYKLLHEIYNKGGDIEEIVKDEYKTYKLKRNDIPEKEWENNYKPKLMTYSDTIRKIFLAVANSEINYNIELAKEIPEMVINNAFVVYKLNILIAKALKTTFTTNIYDKQITFTPEHNNDSLIEITPEEYYVLKYAKETGHIKSGEDIKGYIKGFNTP